MARLSIAVLLFLFPIAVHSQQLPEAPKPKRQTIFFVGTTALAASKSFDAWTTQDLLNRGGYEAENVALGPHPSSSRLVGVAAGDFAIETTLFYFTEHSRHAWVRWSGRASIGFLVEEHLRLGACNNGISVASPKTQVCRSAF